MLPASLRVLYLHGFASSPASRKAAFFRERLEKLGFEVVVPDLAQGNFKGLTISGQLALAERIGQDQPLILIGSSLGGYLASLYAARHPETRFLILLAPAFQFYRLWTSRMSPDELASWKQHGTVDVFHYGAGHPLPIEYNLVEDASRFEPFPDFKQPALIFHGDFDATVPVEYSVEFSQTHPNARLIRLPSDHELTDSLEAIWSASEKSVMAGPLEL